MLNLIIASVGGAVVGAVFTGVASYILFFLRDRHDLKKKKEFFRMAIIDDLKRSVGLYDKIFNDWKKTKQIRYEHTIELKESRKLYQKYEEYILFFSDEIRKKLFNYYVKSSKWIFLLEAQQGRLLELVGEYQKVSQVLKQSLPIATEQEIQQAALNVLTLEDQETANIQARIEKEVDDIKQYKSEAETIIKELEAEL